MRFPALSSARRLCCGLLLCAVLAGCGAHRPVADACFSLARESRYQQALEVLDRSPLAKSRGDRLLYLMERGTLLHLTGNYRESNRVFEAADLLLDELFTRSLSAETLSLLSNDAIIPYAGEDYESLLVNYYKTLNFLALGDLEGARVECRRMDEKLNFLGDWLEDGGGVHGSGYVRLLTGLVYEAGGEWNDAFIAYRKSLAGFRSNQTAQGVAPPAMLWERLRVCAHHAGLWPEYRELAGERAGEPPLAEESLLVVLIHNGAVPVKREDFLLVQTEKGIPVKIAVPRLEERPCGASRLTGAVDGEHWVAAEQIADLAAIARQSLEARTLRMSAKAAARALAKQIAARQAEKELGPWAGVAAQIAALISERADLRSWSTLPGEIWALTLPVPRGQQTVALRLDQSVQRHIIPWENGRIGFLVTRVY